MHAIQAIEKASLRTDLPNVRAGDTVRIAYRIQEGDKSRVQAYEGIVLRVRGTGMGASMTVRKMSFGVGVERTFPTHSPLMEGIQVLQHAKVRRARLYYMRELKGKAARLKRELGGGAAQAASAVPATPAAVAETSE